MIRRPTVFVIGAGGSVPYKFPSGPQMLRDARSSDPVSLHQAIRERGTRAMTKAFHEALRDAESNSIDSVLEYRPDLDGVGRAYIAARILEAEDLSRDVRPEKGDWLGYLFNQVDSGESVDAFASNPITFITYNYDRRIEYAISRGLRARYCATENQLASLWKQRPVIHLHGSVGTLEKGRDHVPFGGKTPTDTQTFHSLLGIHIDSATRALQIVHQADGKGPQFQQARAALAQAECVIFLGFSFGRANVDRLGLEHINPGAEIICGRYGMRDAEAAVLIREPFITKLNQTPHIAGIGDDCEDVLRNHLDKFVRRY